MMPFAPRRLVAALVCACVFGPAQADGTSFLGIGDVAGGNFASTAQGISGDGLTVVGQGQGANGVNLAIVWTAAGGIRPLYSTSVGGVANKASSNGAFVAGRDNGNGARAFRATSGGQMTYLGGLNPGGNPANQGRAWAISGDATVTVGSVASPASTAGEQAFRYSNATGLVALGFLGSSYNNGISFNSEARDVSGDGSVIVGFSSSSVGQSAFRYTVAGGMTDLGRLSGDSSNYIANGISTDGQVIVGTSQERGSFIWTATGGVRSLDGISSRRSALETNGNGSVIVGFDYLPGRGTTSAVFWQGGTEYILADYLLAQGNTSAAGWDLRQITGISDDGLTVVGSGINPAGFTEGFVVTLSPVPELPSGALFWAGLLGGGLLARRRRMGTRGG